MPRIRIPPEMLLSNPGWTVSELRTAIMVVWKSYRQRVGQAHIFNVRLQKLGTFRSRGNKRPKRRQKVLKRDRERKRKLKKIATLQKQIRNIE